MSDAPRVSRIGRARELTTVESATGVVSGDDIDWPTSPVGGTIDQWKQPVRAATTGSVTISTALNNGDTLDGVTLATGDRVLVKDQSTGSQNGIYIVGATPERAADFDEDGEILGAIVYVIAGTANTATAWKVTNTSAVTVGATTISFAAFGAGGSLTDHTHAATGSGATGGGATLSPTTLNLPTATSPAQTAEGSAVWDSDDDKLTIGTGAARKTLVNEGAATASGLTMATARMLGRSSASTGAIEEITVGTGLLLSGGDLSAVGGSATITTKDEGSTLSSTVTTLDFVGAGVTASGSGATTTITIPGGGASYPGSVEGLYAWFKADAISGLSNGATMTEWRNSAPGIAFDLIAFGAPTYQTNVVNSLPVVRLGGSAYFGYVMPPLAASKPWTLFIVHKMSSLTPTYSGLWGFGWSDVGGIFVKSNGKTAIYAPGSIYDGTGSITYGTVNWNYSAFVFGQTLTSRRSGSADVTGATLALSGGLQGLGYLGNQAVSSRVYSGDIAEVLLYGRVLTSTEITAVESYITGKYSI